MGHLAGRRHLAEADLVRDLPRLLVAGGIIVLALEVSQEAQGVARHGGIGGERLEAGDERVAAEGAGVPGDPGGDDGKVEVIDRERLQVGDRLLERAGEYGVGGAEAGGLLRVAPVRLVGGGSAQLEGPRRAVRDRSLLVQPPHLAGRPPLDPGSHHEGDLHPLRRLEVHVHAGTSPEQLTEPAAPAHPFRPDLGDVAATVPPIVAQDHAVLLHPREVIGAALRPPGAAHLEDVGEVCRPGQLDPAVHRFALEVGEREPVHQDVVDEHVPAQVDEVERFPPQQAALVEAGDGEVDLCDVVGGDLRGEAERWTALHRELPGGEMAGVGQEESQVAGAGGRDVAQAIGHHEEVAALQDQLVDPGRLRLGGGVGVPEERLGRGDGTHCARVVHPPSSARAAGRAVPGRSADSAAR